jgi:hypothetical protein
VRALLRVEVLGELRVDHHGGRGPRDTNRYSVTIPHPPGRVAPCDASCRREGSHPVGKRVAARRGKGRTLRPEPSGTVKEPSSTADAPAAHRRVAARTVHHKAARRTRAESGRPRSAVPSEYDVGILRSDISRPDGDYDEGITKPGDTR